MKESSLEKRVEALERELLNLRTDMEKSPEASGWKAFVGAFVNDPYFKKAMDIGKNYRESLKPKRRTKRKPSNGDT